MDTQPILPVTVSVKKIKGAARQRYGDGDGDGVVRCQKAFMPNVFNVSILRYQL